MSVNVFSDSSIALSAPSTLVTERPPGATGWKPRAAPPRPTLLVVKGPDRGTLLPFPETGEIIAGRSEDCVFRLDDPSVSRRHARFTVQRSADALQVHVEDLGSTNGTHVGQRPVEGSLELLDTDHVHVGDVELRFRFMDPDDIRIHTGLRREVEAAKRDALTGLYTRRYISERLPGLIAAHRRNRVPLSIALLDLDYFKAVNDSYGHVQGDGVLFAVAEAVRSCIRGADIAVRYGGEEFAVVLPGASDEVAARVGERIRAAVARLAFPGTQPPLKTTVSIGVATLTRGEEVEAWFERADMALYAAKAAGRDRVEIARDLSLS